ncbi:MAG TPA: glycosyltransferase family 2 protein, partial [Pirellulales bacterium]
MGNPLRPGVTAVIVALNEEKQLPGLFASLRWCDGVVVVDGGSRDATTQLCRAAGVVFRERPFDDFASQRNFAVSLATTEWVLSIDADERPTRSFVSEVRSAIADRRRAAYRVPIRSVVLGRAMRFGGTQDDLPIRLFRRSLGRWEGAVHERLIVEGSVGRLRSHLAHTTLPTLPSFLAKVNRYANLAAD